MRGMKGRGMSNEPEEITVYITAEEIEKMSNWWWAQKYLHIFHLKDKGVPVTEGLFPRLTNGSIIRTFDHALGAIKYTWRPESTKTTGAIATKVWIDDAE